MQKYKILEQKRINDFLVEFPVEFDIKPYAIRKINKPKFTNGKWENIKIEFIDFIGPSTSQSLFTIVNFINTHGDESLFKINITSFDITGNEPIELWEVSVKNVITIDFGELDYDNNEHQKLFLVLEPLTCVLRY